MHAFEREMLMHAFAVNFSITEKAGSLITARLVRKSDYAVVH
jgi:hypothetical protein